MWASYNIAPANMLFYPLYYDIISLTSLDITQAFYLLLGFAENQTVFWDFKIRNSIRINEGSDNGDSYNRGPIVFSTYTSNVLATDSVRHAVPLVSTTSKIHS